MVLGLAVCYLFGTVWFVRVYASNGNDVTFMTALGWCVFPYIIPDLIKIALAKLIGSRVKAALKLK
ncbi:MAG: biotin transporter BioY, partial [Clostridia bacterium]|nr:biotin transporter BioY [Clostridia bacterium]